RSLGTAMEIESIAAEISDPLGRAAAHAMLGASHHLSGGQAKARFHLEASLALAGNTRPTDPGHFAFSRPPELALCAVMWLQGYPDQAISLVDHAVRAPMSDVDPVTSCIGLIWTATAYGWLGDWAMVEKQVERMMAHADAHFLVPYRNVALGL